jgi:ankyrin repeat protein
MPLTKENSVYRTHEIKSNMLCNLKTALQKLYFHTKDGNFIKFKEIYEKSKLNVDSIDQNGNSLLSLAVQCGCYEVAEYLLNCGADVNSQNV